MASFWQKTLFYLGLVDEDGPESEPGGADVGEVRTVDSAETTAPTAVTARPPGSVVGRRIDPPDRQRRRVSSDPAHAEAGLYVQPGGTGTFDTAGVEPESRVIVARNFSDAQTLADSIRMGKAVVLDLRSTEPEMVRRLVDFTSGLTYALDGKMAKIARGVILVTPVGASISVEEQERLAALGLYATTR